MADNAPNLITPETESVAVTKSAKGKPAKRADATRQLRSEEGTRAYNTREIAEATEAYKAGRVFRRPHSDAVLRLGMGIVTVAFVIVTLCLIVMSFNYVHVSRSLDTRPLYLKDEESVTFRLRRANTVEKTKYLRDQLEEFVSLVIPALYTHTPEGQPQIDILGNLVHPDIIAAEKKNYEDRSRTIVARREIRTAVINYIEVVARDDDRRFASIKVNGSLIYNSFKVAQAFPIEWQLLIELQPEIKSGPNVYGMVIMRLKETGDLPTE